ncbi:MAG: glycosyltransferase [Candidatus Nanopelagicales bacterium]
MPLGVQTGIISVDQLSVKADPPAANASTDLSGLHVCTIIARNYLAHAKVLWSSFAEFNPGVTMTTLVVDGRPDDRELAHLGRVVIPEELGIDAAVLTSMKTIYNVMELSTALKPFLLQHLVREGYLSVSYFDPDIRFFGPVTQVLADAIQSDIVLTPHCLQAVPRDGRNLNEQSIMAAGMYNLGFIAVGSGAFSFLSWWHERLISDAVSDPAHHLFTDQKWIDWVPSLRRHRIAKDPGLNVAYWNAHERPITTDDGHIQAGGAPLRFFHFSGYSPEKPWLLSKHMGANPRVRLSEQPELRNLCDEYAEALRIHGFAEYSKIEYGLGATGDGLELTAEIRALVRKELVEGSPPELLPDPYSSPEEFRQWLTAPKIQRGSRSISRIEDYLWQIRKDLRSAFPDTRGKHFGDFYNWLRIEEPFQHVFPQSAQMAASVTDGRREESPRGNRTDADWSVVGYLTAEVGVGEAGRRILRGAQAVGLPVNAIDLADMTRARCEHPLRTEISDVDSLARRAIVCVNADQFPRISRMIKLKSSTDRRIGLWFWELSEFPDKFKRAFDHVDEVWVASEFTRAAIAAKTEKPVHIVTMPVPRFTTASHSKDDLGLPLDRTNFLVSFDFDSVEARKNPLGAIDAYKRAFTPSDGAHLIIKTLNGRLHQERLERLRVATSSRPDIVLQDGFLSSSQMFSLQKNVDCIVSLHRSEGYGLHLADSLAMGTPVVATRYSGNLTFMPDDHPGLVDYDLVNVGQGAAPYSPDAVWAEPCLDSAARAMRRIVDEPESVRARADADAVRMRDSHSVDVAASAMRSRLMPFLAGTKGESR